MTTKQSRRRGNNEGTIRQRPSKNGKAGLWVARIVLPTGERRSIYRRTRKEVADALAELQHDVQVGSVTVGGQQTVAVFLQRWLDDVVKVKNKYRTWESYSHLV